MLSVDNRKAIIGFSLSIILFWLIKKYMLDPGKQESQIDQPPINDEDIEVAIAAYKSAQDAGEPQAVLNDLNSEFAQEYGFKVYQRVKDGRYVVTDLSGKEVKTI